VRALPGDAHEDEEEEDEDAEDEEEDEDADDEAVGSAAAVVTRILDSATAVPSDLRLMRRTSSAVRPREVRRCA
jgi:hypothetical protein